MVETTLTNDLIEGGKLLIQQLDRSKLTIDAALWSYLSELGGWRLILGVKELDRLGPKKVYRTIQSVLHRTQKTLPEGSRVSLDEITILAPGAPLFKLLRIAVGTGSGISGLRFSNNVINGQLVEDAYIYRLR